MIDYLVMDMTTGDLVGSVYATREEAEDFIDNQDYFINYEIIERE